MKEIVFLVHEAEEGGFHAEAVDVGIFAEGETVDELKENIKGGIDCYYNKAANSPTVARLQFLKDEIMAL